MKKSFISICFVLIVSLIILSEDVSSQELIENPSQTPLSNESTSWGNERYRLIGDMNFDGLSDLILSDALFKSGTGGVGFTVYLQDSSGLYREIGKTGGKKSTISIEKNYREIRLWAYWHISGSSGILGYQIITDSSLVDGMRMEIYPGDGGTKISNGIFYSIFNNSDVDFKIEISKTENGIVTWSETK